MDLPNYLTIRLAERDDGTIPIHVYTDDAPDWFRMACHDIHDGMMPDDWTYDAINEAWSAIGDYDNADEARDDSHAIADNLVEYRTWHLLEWAKSHTDDIDEAIDEFGFSNDGIVGVVRLGQFTVLQRIVITLCDAIEENIVEDEDEDA